LTAHSVYGRGATFVCRLPRILEAPNDEKVEKD
jgi:hypothetical protein